MLKAINLPPGSDDIEAVLNKHIRDCRRVVERVFGIMKSRWKSATGISN